MSSYEQRQPAPAQQPQTVEDSGPSLSTAIAKRLAPLVIVAALLAVFIIQNDATTTVKFITWEWDIRVAWALLIAAVAGYVVGWLALAVWRHRRNRS